MTEGMDKLIQAAVEGHLTDPGVLRILADRASREIHREDLRREAERREGAYRKRRTVDNRDS